VAVISRELREYAPEAGFCPDKTIGGQVKITMPDGFRPRIWRGPGREDPVALGVWRRSAFYAILIK
jgi:hypothetical protein